MKKLVIVILTVFLLAGCGSRQTFETVDDEYLQSVMAPVQQVVVSLPEDASVAVMESDQTGTLYLCDGYTATLQTLPGGNLDQTLKEITGFSRERLHPIQTTLDGVTSTHCVWTAIGEKEEQVGRLTVLDDGNYHYVLACMADASQTESLQGVWQELFDSFRLISPEVDLHTGS